MCWREAALMRATNVSALGCDDVIGRYLHGSRSPTIMLGLVAILATSATFNSTQQRRRPCPLLHTARCR
jgi:hypothetical protein